MQTVAEREAWRFAGEHGLDLVAVLPNFVLGPVISSRADGTSVGFMKVVGFPAFHLKNDKAWRGQCTDLAPYNEDIAESELSCPGNL